MMTPKQILAVAATILNAGTIVVAFGLLFAFVFVVRVPAAYAIVTFLTIPVSILAIQARLRWFRANREEELLKAGDCSVADLERGEQ